MTTPVLNNRNACNRVVTPHTDSAPAAWNTPEFHIDSAMVTQQLRDGVGVEAMEDFLAFLASPSGNRVLTYNRECHEGVKQMTCNLSGLSALERSHLNRICANQGWGST